MLKSMRDSLAKDAYFNMFMLIHYSWNTVVASNLSEISHGACIYSLLAPSKAWSMYIFDDKVIAYR